MENTKQNLTLCGVVALAAGIGGCFASLGTKADKEAQGPYTFKQRKVAYTALTEDLKDGTSMTEAKAALRMIFDARSDKVMNTYNASERTEIATWTNSLMETVRNFYNAEGEIIVYAQRQEGEGRNAKIQSKGGLKMVSTGMSLNKFRAAVEEHYKGDQAKIDEVLRAGVRVASAEFSPVQAQRNRRFNVDSWNERFAPMDVNFLNYLLNKAGGKFGSEENPGEQITAQDGKFGYAGFGAIVKGDAPYTAKANNPSSKTGNLDF